MSKPEDITTQHTYNIRSIYTRNIQLFSAVYYYEHYAAYETQQNKIQIFEVCFKNSNFMHTILCSKCLPQPCHHPNSTYSISVGMNPWCWHLSSVLGDGDRKGEETDIMDIGLCLHNSARHYTNKWSVSGRWSAHTHFLTWNSCR